MADPWLKLQATAGNQAVSQLLARRPTVQRKTLDQAGLAGDLGFDTADQRSIVGDGRPGQVYHERAEVKGGRLEALVKAAEMNARIGKRVHDHAEPLQLGKPRHESWEPKHLWTPTGTALKEAGVRTLDPFHFWTSVFFEPKEGDTERFHQLLLGYQHAKNFTGYIETVYDSSNPGADDYQSMYVSRGGERVTPGTKVGPKGAGERNPFYTNEHAGTHGSKIEGKTGGTDHEAVDAYTKIAGEGARWQCVRRHAANLSDDSRFFLTEEGKTYGITFKTLWLSWVRVFGKRYDIGDPEVATAIWNKKFDSRDEVYNFRPIPGRDYDLDKSGTV